MNYAIERIFTNGVGELISLICFIIGLVIIIISIVRQRNSYDLKIAAILFLISLSLFADDKVCYIVSIITIATIVATPEFCEKIIEIMINRKQ